MHALVTGATGFVGRRLVDELRRCGWTVRCAVRRRSGPEASMECVDVGDLADVSDWSAALAGVDTVFHLAGHVHRLGRQTADAESMYRRVNCEATTALARASIAAGARRFVFVSSVKAVGESSPRAPLVEDDPPRPQDAYGRSKLDAERGLMELGSRIDVSIVRPPLVYGPGVRANFASLMRLAAGGWPLPLGAADARRSLVFVDNLVDALIACATVRHASPAVYFISDGLDLTVAELVTRLRAAIGRPPRLWRVPAPAMRVASRLLGRGDAAQRLFSPLQVDIGRIRRELGWSPPVAVDDGLRQTMRWFVEARAQAAS
jgi:nucleoside-diphosphate-sugar epimerase